MVFTVLISTVPFSYYVKHKHDGLPIVLNKYGYHTVTICGSIPEIWSKGKAYSNLQFEEYYYAHNISLSNIIKYNNDNIADKTMFNKLIELYEKRDRNKGFFVWLTTMQNHAEYRSIVPGGIELICPKNPDAEIYLNLLHQSDLAYKDLIEYFKKQDEHVIVLMFGDHFPHIQSFTEKLFKKPIESLSLDEKIKLHQTPFKIWSNKPMKSRDIGETSLSYLSNYLMEAAGLPKANYQKALDEIKKDIVDINGFAFKGANGQWYNVHEDNPYKEALNKYATLNYYRLFDEYK